MAKRHREILAKLDPIAVYRYQITEKDIRTIERYLNIIQRYVIGGSTWQDILTYPGPYATSIVIHELVEIRYLEARGVQSLKLKTPELQAALTAIIDAHNAANYEEHLFLQEYIKREYELSLEVATLIRANRGNEVDLQLFLESDIGVYILEDDKISEAEHLLEQLKGARS